MTFGRIHTIDILRGFFMFMIIVDHLELFPNGFDFLTGRGLLWMSAAEGFFFLSGMMIGIIRGVNDRQQSMRLVSKKLFKRAAILYIWAVGLTVLFSLLAMWLGPENIKSGLWQGNVVSMLWHSLSLQYVYSWADFLRYYAVYLVISIPAIMLLRKNKAWLIAGLAIVAWILGRHYSLFFTWQILFFGGVIAGWYWMQITKWATSLPRNVVYLHYPLALLMLVYSVLVIFGPLSDLNTTLSPYFLREYMPPLRIAVFILWFSAMYRFVRSHEAWFVNTIGKFLIPYGQHSLYVYILSAFVIFGTHYLIPKPQTIIVNFIITGLTLALLWLAIKSKFLFRYIPR